MEKLPVLGAASGETSQPSLVRTLEQLVERVGQLELKIESRQRDPHRQRPTNNRQPIKCRRCGQEGHYMPGVALRAGEEIRETRHPRRFWSCVRGCRSNDQQRKKDISILPVCTTNTYSIPAVIECPSTVSSSQPSKQLSVSLLLDTGAAVSLLRKDKWDLIASPADLPLNPWNGPRLTGVLRRITIECVRLLTDLDSIEWRSVPVDNADCRSTHH